MTDSTSFLRELAQSVIMYPWFFVTAMFSPARVMREKSLTPQTALIFVLGSAVLLSSLVALTAARTPAVISVRGQFLVLVHSLDEWTASQSIGANSIAPTAVASAATILLVTAILAAGLFSLLRWQWDDFRVYRNSVKLVSIPISVATLCFLSGELLVMTLAASPSISLITFAIVGAPIVILRFVVPLYISYATFRTLGASRVLSVVAVPMVWTSATVMLFLFPFSHEATHGGESRLEPMLDRVSALNATDQEEIALELLTGVPDGPRSIHFGAQMARTLHGALVNSSALYDAANARGDDYIQPAEVVVARYDRMAMQFDRLSVQYADVPGMQILLGYWNKVYGRCEQAVTCFRSAYEHHYASRPEELQSGLELRCLGQEPATLAVRRRAYPLDDGLGAMRLMISSPRLAALAVSDAFGDNAAIFDIFDEQQSYYATLSGPRSETAECKCDPVGWGQWVRDLRAVLRHRGGG